MLTTTSPLSSTSLPQGPGCGGCRLTDAVSSQHYVLAPGSTTIGAGPKCDLRLDAPGLRPLHCVIVWNETGATVRRWSAGTSLNGQSFTESALQDGDRLSVGPVDLVVSTDAEITDEETGEETGKDVAEQEPALLEQEIVACFDGLEVLAHESIHEPIVPPTDAEEAIERTPDSESLVDADAEEYAELPMEEPGDCVDWHTDQDLATDEIQAPSEAEDCSFESAADDPLDLCPAYGNGADE